MYLKYFVHVVGIKEVIARMRGVESFKIILRKSVKVDCIFFSCYSQRGFETLNFSGARSCDVLLDDTPSLFCF